VEFDWDPAKSGATLRERGFDFAYASRIFAGPRLEATDARTDYGEVRIRAIGQVGPDIVTVVYTVRGSLVRIISARRASRKERSQWLTRG
jgi:hypothetical protein